MSWEQVKAARRIPGLPPRERVTLEQLAEHFNARTTRCNPSLSLLAAETAQSKREVRYVVEKLKRRGLIEVTSGGGRRTSDYALRLSTASSTPWQTVPPSVAKQQVGDACTSTSANAQNRRSRPVQTVPPKQKRNKEINALARAAPSGRAAAQNPDALPPDHPDAIEACDYCDELGYLWRANTVYRCTHRVRNRQEMGQIVNLERRGHA